MAHRAQTPRKQRPISEERREKLRQAQLAYVQNDPRWAEHRRRLADAQKKPEQKARLSAAQRLYMALDPRWPDHRARMMEAAGCSTRMTLFPAEVDQIVEMRRQGRNFEYIAEELRVGEKIIRRELKKLGIAADPVKVGPRVRRGRGFWRSFDPA